MADYQYDSSLTVCLIAWRVELLVRVWWLAIPKDVTNHFGAVSVPWLEPTWRGIFPSRRGEKRYANFAMQQGNDNRGLYQPQSQS